MATNFNPQEQSSLLALLTALKGGMTGSTGTSMLANILSQQQARAQANQQHLASLSDLLVNQAQAGNTYRQDSILADAYTPKQGYGQNVQQVLDAVYPQRPNQGQPPVPTNYQGQPLDFPQGSAPTQPQTQPNMSPLYTPPQPTIQDVAAQQGVQEGRTNQAAAQILATQLVDSSIAAGIAPEQIVNGIIAAPQYQSMSSQMQSEIIVAAQQYIAQKVAEQAQQPTLPPQQPGGITPEQTAMANAGNGNVPGVDYSAPSGGFWGNLFRP